jgi:predicted N-acetyltransferase YhbS
MTVAPDPQAVTSLPVRRLAAADLPACVALALDRGWEPGAAKWQLLHETGEIFGVDDPAGGLAAAVALTRYGPRLAAIGKMLVANRYGRQGLGHRLMTHALSQLGGTVSCLLATEFGRPLYERLGFRAIDTSARYVGQFAPDPANTGPSAADLSAADLSTTGPVPRPVTEADQPAIAELDRHAFGADRSRLLARLPQLTEQFLVTGGLARQSVRGYAASWRWPDTLTIGPVVADDLAVAIAMIESLAAGPDRPVRLEVPGRHPGLAGWAAGHGLTVQARATFMVHGGELPGSLGQLFCPVSMAMC